MSMKKNYIWDGVKSDFTATNNKIADITDDTNSIFNTQSDDS